MECSNESNKQKSSSLEIYPLPGFWDTSDSLSLFLLKEVHLPCSSPPKKQKQKKKEKKSQREMQK